MSYGKNLMKRLRTERQKAKRNPAPQQYPGDHPNRYPKHADPLKGQLWNGECNTTRCTNHRAVYFNQFTFGLYCQTCADGHNWQRHKPPISIPVASKPTIEQMNHFRQELSRQMSIADGGVRP